MPVRFAFDLGTTSIGWAVYDLDPALWKTVHKARLTGLRKLGVRLFDDGRDPQTGDSHAANRRLPRAMRRQQDRRLARRDRLERDLMETGLLPPPGLERDRLFTCAHPYQTCAEADDADCRNPYRLRALAATGKISLHDLGRALWHISKHRGFASNRKTDPDEDDTGLIKSAARALAETLTETGHATYGTYLWSRLKAGEGVRVRPQGEGAEKHYDFYPTRQMLDNEFDAIWTEQAKHHSELTDAVRDRLRETIFFQRPLRPVDPGRCTFFPQKPRLPRWHPSAQAFLILQQLGHLRIIRETHEERLDPDKHRVLFDALNGGQKMTWTQVRKTLGLTSQDDLNLHSGGLKHLHFNQVAAALLGTKKPGPLAEQWPGYDTATREQILAKLADTENPDALRDWLTGTLALDAHTAAAVEKVRLPDGHLRFCREATEAMVAEMRSGDVLTYNEAVNRAPLLSGIDFTDSRPEKGVCTLPYYNELDHMQRLLGNGTGNPEHPHDMRLGRITNPTVHIALNQFRRVINGLIAEYGKPAQVVLEATRDLGRSPREKAEIEKTIKANEKRNDRYRADLEEAGYLKPGQRVGDLFLKMRLWEELGRNEADRCSPFTGRPIGLHDLHSDAVEIEHILPFGETLDNSPANKTLAFRDENRRKGKLSPGEAAELGIFDQEAMIERTKHLPRNKAWRFLPDAMEVFEEQKSFEDRQLHATGYLAKVVRGYAETLFDKTDVDGTERRHIWMLPGRMTALLRHRWGLNLSDHNRKNRDDHRHHAIDAAVIGVIDRAIITQLQKAAKQHGADALSRVLPAPPEPFEGFRDAVMTAIRDVRASHRARHVTADATDPSQTSGRLHEATAYGPVRDVPENQADLTIGNVVVRKPVTALTAKEIGLVRDVAIRHDLQEATAPARAPDLPKTEADKVRAKLLAEWSARTGHRRLRLLKAEASVRAVHDSNGTAYKYHAPGENACLDIIDVDGTWRCHALTLWDANSGQNTHWRDLYPDASFIMRLHKEDTLQLFDWDDEEGTVIPGSNAIKRVVRLSPSNNVVYLAGLNEAGKLQQRHGNEEDDFTWDFANISKLKFRRARRVRIDELGKVHTIPHGKV
ncbi:hypothetical protein E2L08_16435 [Palleronia sediminis]|uniref:CRISPR-associated endonuclease Cas9 n=1 Tax=Palleronia sediminis TaxID=2547833 RepID=A0A4V3B847_9RHOB|nr:type II CRISPR RNA-guided endonuclease Cas9 [Palleronia sediminis]TDL74159.1 hypothetical protein E2L08_16435 [Palleronia sediminis]